MSASGAGSWRSPTKRGCATSAGCRSHHNGRDHPDRERPRVSARVEIDRWHGWGAAARTRWACSRCRPGSYASGVPEPGVDLLTPAPPTRPGAGRAGRQDGRPCAARLRRAGGGDRFVGGGDPRRARAHRDGRRPEHHPPPRRTSRDRDGHRDPLHRGRSSATDEVVVADQSDRRLATACVTSVLRDLSVTRRGSGRDRGLRIRDHLMLYDRPTAARGGTRWWSTR